MMSSSSRTLVIAFFCFACGSPLSAHAQRVVDPARLTIPAEDPKPAIHGPAVIGATPGRPFLFLIPATGTPPIAFSAKGLPKGLSLDTSTGIITGSLRDSGKTVATIRVRNSAGSTERHLTILGGDHMLAQTPPMGWNSWNVWAGNVTDANVRAAADAMVASGLASHGYQYVNIDDTWEGERDSTGRIQTNAKFPSLAELTSYVHAKGLKVGIYSSPGPQTCGRFTGSYEHEDQDAQSYSDWGFDYLKYDWCSYAQIANGDNSLNALQKPYAVMRAALDKTNRDIVFSFCQYGMGDVAKWGAQVGGNCWRTTGDIKDSWGSLHGIYERQDRIAQYAGPGHWNDPDMLVVGQVGWGHPHPSRLTPNEQILHMTLWCLDAAPLLIGCDMTKLDDFTRAVLTNDEVIDIDQDPLGIAARKLPGDVPVEVWWRPLSDGTIAAGLINPTDAAATGSVNWADIGAKSSEPVRDLWMHKDLGKFQDSYSVEVPAHGAVLLKIGKE